MTDDVMPDLGVILGVWAHPDDEAYLSAGLMADAVAAGRRVVCVTATRGELGFPETDPRPLAERGASREAELEACLAVLGVEEHRWLGYADGDCAAVPDHQGAEAIGELIEEVRPDTVLTFGPDGATGHPDHIAVCRWSTLAVRSALHPARLLYATKPAEWNEAFLALADRAEVMMDGDAELPWSPPEEISVWAHLGEGLTDLKVAALRCQGSQVEPMVELAGIEAFRRLVRDEYFRDAPPDAFT